MTTRISSARRFGTTLAAAGLLCAGVATLASRSSAEEGIPVPAPTLDENKTAAPASEVAVVAGGCFWGIQGVFQHVKGVSEAVSGYAGGKKGTATYDQVSDGDTGHAESVKITFDPKQISYGQILQIYFSAMDPTQLNRQGPDGGTQYRSTIFPHSAEQAKIAEAYKVQLTAAHAFSRPIVTTIEADKAFYPAEAHHQNFLARNPNYPYIAVNDMPKIENLQRLYPGLYREDPVLVANVGAQD